MPFDLTRAASLLRQRHSDAFGFRFGLLDLLFAAGCHVREQAVALPWGDALVVRTSGPAAPSAQKRLVVVAIDLELPGLHGADPQGRWPTRLQSLGGPSLGIAWLAVLHGLLSSHAQRPWELLYVRGPALGTAEFAADLLATEAADADLAVLSPAAAGGATEDAALDLVRLEMARPRNIWRFPACDFTARIEGQSPLGQAWYGIRQVLATLGPAAAWTLHDLKIQAGENAPFSAVLRSSAPAKTPADGDGTQVAVRAIEGELRLLFPINDALSALSQLGDRLPASLADALSSPLHAATLPDGLCLHALAPQLPEDLDLADRAAAMTAQWSTAPVTRPFAGTVRPLAVAAAENCGPVVALLPAHAELWRTPALDSDDDLPALLRAVGALAKTF